jgi:hypothetical protein
VGEDMQNIFETFQDISEDIRNTFFPTVEKNHWFYKEMEKTSCSFDFNFWANNELYFGYKIDRHFLFRSEFYLEAKIDEEESVITIYIVNRRAFEAKSILELIARHLEENNFQYILYVKQTFTEYYFGTNENGVEIAHWLNKLLSKDNIYGKKPLRFQTKNMKNELVLKPNILDKKIDIYNQNSKIKTLSSEKQVEEFQNKLLNFVYEAIKTLNNIKKVIKTKTDEITITENNCLIFGNNHTISFDIDFGIDKNTICLTFEGEEYTSVSADEFYDSLYKIIERKYKGYRLENIFE